MARYVAEDLSFQPFVDALVELADREGWQVRHDYGGRGMMGERCLGLVHNRASEFDIALEILQEMASRADEHGVNIVDMIDHLANLRTKVDSIGRSTIMYWEDIKVSREGEAEDEEEEDC